jgi:hypothetical protein
MVFDWTVTLGNVLTVAGFVVAGFAIVWSIKMDVLLLTQRIVSLEKELEKLSDIVSSTASSAAKQDGRLNVQDERINMLSSRVLQIGDKLDRGTYRPQRGYNPDNNGTS